METLLESVNAVDAETDPKDSQKILQGLHTWGHKYIKHTVELMERFRKPILGVTLTSDPRKRSIYEVENSKFNGVFFNSPERAVKALGHMCKYRDFLEKESAREGK